MAVEKEAIEGSYRNICIRKLDALDNSDIALLQVLGRTTGRDRIDRTVSLLLSLDRSRSRAGVHERYITEYWSF
jgi:hypothetical protein